MSLYLIQIVNVIIQLNSYRLFPRSLLLNANKAEMIVIEGQQGSNDWDEYLSEFDKIEIKSLKKINKIEKNWKKKLALWHFLQLEGR